MHYTRILPQLTALLWFTLVPAQAVLVPVAEDATATTNIRTGTPTVSAVAGRATTLAVSARETALVRFNLFDPSTVPATVSASNITMATLRLYVIGTKPGVLTVHSVTSAWTEDVGATTPAPTIDVTALATIPAESVAGKHVIVVDVTAAVKAALTSGNNDFGFAIQTATPGAKLRIGSKEGPGLGQPASLQIETTAGADGLDGSVTDGKSLILESGGTLTVNNG